MGMKISPTSSGRGSSENGVMLSVRVCSKPARPGLFFGQLLSGLSGEGWQPDHEYLSPVLLRTQCPPFPVNTQPDRHLGAYPFPSLTPFSLNAALSGFGFSLLVGAHGGESQGLFLR